MSGFRTLIAAALIAAGTAANAAPQWLSLPPTPTLPKPDQSGLAPVNGVKIWYASFGSGEPVILLHGGLANSNYWGHQVRALAGAISRHRHGQPRPWPLQPRREAVWLRPDGRRRRSR